MGKHKRIIGLVLALIVGITVYNSSFAGLSPAGQTGLAISLFGVICWATGVAMPGYVALLMLVAYVLTKTAPRILFFQFGKVIWFIWLLPDI